MAQDFETAVSRFDLWCAPTFCTFASVVIFGWLLPPWVHETERGQMITVGGWCLINLAITFACGIADERIRGKRMARGSLSVSHAVRFFAFQAVFVAALVITVGTILCRGIAD